MPLRRLNALTGMQHTNSPHSTRKGRKTILIRKFLSEISTADDGLSTVDLRYLLRASSSFFVYLL